MLPVHSNIIVAWPTGQHGLWGLTLHLFLVQFMTQAYRILEALLLQPALQAEHADSC